jgi:3-oxosteroid 1-dehydrogenase
MDPDASMDHQRLKAKSGLWEPADKAEFDVIVIGSGAAGLTAALRAAVQGAHVLILEKSALIGGTSAMSGAGTWIPCNRYASEAGIADSREDAMTYLRSASPEGWRETEDALWQSFVEHAPAMIDFVEAHTPIRYELLSEPDPKAESPGGKVRGRMLSPRPLSRRLLAGLAGKLRPSTMPQVFTYQELIIEDLYHAPLLTIVKLAPQLLWRWLTGRRAQGAALIIGLMKGCLDHGCRLSLDSRASGLILDEKGAVTGVAVSIGGQSYSIGARRGVVLATGGFEWNSDLRNRHFPGGVQWLGSPSTNEGDGQMLAAKAGARLERMDQANIYPCLPTFYEGRLHGVPYAFQAETHAILINARGERFVSEYDYNVGEALDRRDAATGQPINLPAWVIGDGMMWKASAALRWYAAKDPGWVKRAGTLEALAGMIGIAPHALVATVVKWNGFCASGVDEDFHRGESVWDRYKSKNDTGAHHNRALGTIERPPFLALSLNRSILGTKGGARTNAKGEVLREDGTVIAGLYAAGNAMANPIGTRAIGAGTTIGPCMTWGYICAKSILAANR